MKNRIMAGLMALCFAIPLSIGFTAVGGTATATAAEASTIIRTNCYKFYQYGYGNQLELWQRCWVDYNWWEETWGSRDCYCWSGPVLYWPPR